MKVLGIDPGSRKIGFALIEIRDKKIVAIQSGILDVSKEKNFLIRIKSICEQCEEWVREYEPDEISLESLIFVKDPRALIKLGQARGAMLSIFTRTHIEKIFEYSPNYIKEISSGYGHAGKEEIQNAVKQKLGITKFKTHDESDALAIALCHILERGFLVQANRQSSAESGLFSSSKKRSLSASLGHKTELERERIRR